jgi:hypothetical protein
VRYADSTCQHFPVAVLWSNPVDTFPKEPGNMRKRTAAVNFMLE